MRPTRPQPVVREVQAFLQQYFQDLEQGRHHDRAHYVGLFHHSEAVGRAWDEVTRDAATGEEVAQVGPYRLVRLLGQGGQGEVHLARDDRVGRDVALKCLPAMRPVSPEALARFRREAEVASKLDHPAICPIHELNWAEGRPYIAMPYFEGETLAHRMSRERGHRTQTHDDDGGSTHSHPEQVMALMETVARALHAAHEAGVVHRDVKPGNIMVRTDGEPVVLDFGVAGLLDDGGETGLTLTGQIVGTVPYMAPEQVDVARGIPDRRVDVFSLGVCLYEALTLKHPFSRDTVERTRSAILAHQPTSVARLRTDLPRDVGVVVETALQKDPDHRYATALAFADDLRRVRAREPILARPAGPVLRLRRWSQRNPVLAFAVAGLLVTLTGGWGITQVLLGRTSRALENESEALGALRTERSDLELTLDGLLVSDLRGRVDELWPATPARVRDADGMDPWLRDAERIVASLPRYRAELKALRERALPLPPESAARAARRRARLQESLRDLEMLRDDPPFNSENAARSARIRAEKAIPSVRARLEERELWEFAHPKDHQRHLALRRLVKEVPTLVPLVDRVRQRRQLALSLEEATVNAHADGWKRAAESIANDPRFAELRLKPQVGLVPIGPDPESGLQEFAHLGTGTVPQRDAETGALTVGDDTGLIFVLVPGGRARLGAVPPDETHAEGDAHVDPNAEPDEPLREVDLHPFFISKFEMTQGQWRRVTGANPSAQSAGRKPGNLRITLAHPVEQVSWVDADRWLSRLELELPTDAQWEYAARAGTGTAWWTGNQKESMRGAANLADKTSASFGSIANWAHQLWLDDGFLTHAPVGSFRENPFGLHDLMGNVYEWCRDGRGTWLRTPRPGDGLRPGTEPVYRVSRGSAYNDTHLNARSADVKFHTRTHRAGHIGLRPSRKLEE